MARRGPRPTEERLKRLLVMLPWLMDNNPAPIEEMSARFELSERDLVADLELAAMCGLPPYLDEVIDVFIDEGYVHLGVPRIFIRPLRLTAPEGFALLSAGRAAMALPGADAQGSLGRALDKLAAALGDDGVVVDLERPALVDALAEACNSTAEQRIVYWSKSSQEQSERDIVPRAVFTDDGFWYVLADDSKSAAERVFRVDRIISATPTGRRGTIREVTLPDTQRWLDDDGELPRAVIVIDREHFVSVERFPVDSIEELPGDRMRITLPVSNETWLATVLVGLGPHVQVQSPGEWVNLAARRARKLRARYATTSD